MAVETSSNCTKLIVEMDTQKTKMNHLKDPDGRLGSQMAQPSYKSATQQYILHQ